MLLSLQSFGLTVFQKINFGFNSSLFRSLLLCLYHLLLLLVSCADIFGLHLQRIWCYSRSISLLVQTMKVQEVCWHGAVFIYYLFLYIFVNALLRMSPSVVKMMVILLQRLCLKKRHFFAKIHFARLQKVQEMQNVSVSIYILPLIGLLFFVLLWFQVDQSFVCS